VDNFSGFADLSLHPPLLDNEVVGEVGAPPETNSEEEEGAVIFPFELPPYFLPCHDDLPLSPPVSPPRKDGEEEEEEVSLVSSLIA
jgi:hypothetical protein